MEHILIDNKKTVFPPLHAPPADDPQTQPLHEEAGLCGQKSQVVPDVAEAAGELLQSDFPYAIAVLSISNLSAVPIVGFAVVQHILEADIVSRLCSPIF